MTKTKMALEIEALIKERDALSERATKLQTVNDESARKINKAIEVLRTGMVPYDKSMESFNSGVNFTINLILKAYNSNNFL